MTVTCANCHWALDSTFLVGEMPATQIPLCEHAQSCLTLCVDCSLRGYPLHEIFQATIVPLLTLEDLPDPEIEPISLASWLAGRFFTNCATWEAPMQISLFPQNLNSGTGTYWAPWWGLQVFYRSLVSLRLKLVSVCPLGTSFFLLSAVSCLSFFFPLDGCT